MPKSVCERHLVERVHVQAGEAQISIFRHHRGSPLCLTLTLWTGAGGAVVRLIVRAQVHATDFIRDLDTALELISIAMHRPLPRFGTTASSVFPSCKRPSHNLYFGAP
ncbi:hypothetical protein MRB53_041735 [Persea americana]|nr:hypothetical protein MRB53_041735 [Persea americana]